ncbi:hypothetical protein DFJ73DRAFT_823270 [Zopfochytrium polystomum]|nr:hypothetical protein DFJ73DRAFT_823270 [Zopfochytrium polystomum]
MKIAALPILALLSLFATGTRGDAVGLGAASVDATKCPLYGKCPYDHVQDKLYAAGSGCPLQNGGCPYYDAHKDDHSLLDIVTEDDHKCPLSGKCKFFDDMKTGSKVNLSGENCPLAEKCPYYKEIKSGDATSCPLEKACPHFSKDFAKGGHGHHGKAGDSHDARECPHLKRQALVAEKHNEL